MEFKLEIMDLMWCGGRFIRELQWYEVADLADYLETPGPNNDENEQGLNVLSEEAIESDDVPNIGTKMDDQPDEHLFNTSTVAPISGVCVPVARGTITPGPPNALKTSSAVNCNNSQSETEVSDAASPTNFLLNLWFKRRRPR